MAKTNAKKRIASYELLRVIAMFMVVLLHFNTQSGALMTQGEETTAVGIAAGIVESFCICAVNVYVLITGYFMCEARWGVRRLLRLWLQILSYSIVIPVILTMLTIQVNATKGVWELMEYLLPISMKRYWFATAYFLLYMLIPVLNKAVHALTRRQLKTVICLLLLFYSVIKSISPMALVADDYGYGTMWFVVLYLIAAYIRLYDVPRFNHPGKAAATYVISCVLIAALHLGLHQYNLQTGRLEYYAGVPFHYNAILTLTAAIGLFYLFKFVHIEEGVLARFARGVAPYTFGVYIIHEHIDIRTRWVPEFANILGQEMATTPVGYLLQALGYCLVLYAICIIIDMVRTAVFKALCKGLTNSVIDEKITRIDTLFNE